MKSFDKDPPLRMRDAAEEFKSFRRERSCSCAVANRHPISQCKWFTPDFLQPGLGKLINHARLKAANDAMAVAAGLLSRDA
jgi:hypothetical protein